MKIQKETVNEYLQTNPIDNQDALDLLENDDSENEFIEIDPNEVSNELLRFIIFNDTNLNNEDKTLLTRGYFSIEGGPSSLENDAIWNTKIKTLEN
jgi:hypothetical protein